MNQPLHHHAVAASRGAPCLVAGVHAACLDSGIAAGLIVVDSNRPAALAATARGLLKQFGVAH